MADAYVRHRFGLVRTSAITGIDFDPGHGGSVIVHSGLDHRTTVAELLEDRGRATDEQRRASAALAPGVAESLAIAIDEAEGGASQNGTVKIIRFEHKHRQWLIENAHQNVYGAQPVQR